jgi:hypothetical protein
MNPLPRRIITGLAATTVWATACGPFFPDTVLDLPQAALRVRSSCFLDEIIEIDIACGTRFSARPAGRTMVERTRQSQQRDWRLTEEQAQAAGLQAAVAPLLAAGMPAEVARETRFGDGQTRTEALDLALVLLDRRVPPVRVGEIVGRFVGWRSGLPAVDCDDPCAIATPAAAEVPAPPDCPEVPADIRACWGAARAFCSGDRDGARAAWGGILGLPAGRGRERAIWAAWMLAKTSPDMESALRFYQKIGGLAAAGCRDPLGLAPRALGWRAWEWCEPDPVAALKLYFEAACSGDESMLISLRRRCAEVIAGPEATLARAAADPLAREIVTVTVFALHDGPHGWPGEPDPRASAWLAQLERNPAAKPSPSAAKAAWLCYGRGDFEAAARWLEQAPAGAGEVLWLQAKLALREGRLDRAARFFATAAPFYQLDAGGGGPAEPHIDELQWFDHRGRRDWMRGQFHTDRAITHLARGEFLRALGFLHKAGYHDDAAYLAERVLTTDELVGWVKEHCPQPERDADAATFQVALDGSIRPPGDGSWWDRGWIGEPMRYVLARRLAREFRFREAAGFMPPALKPLFDHYVKLHRAARSGRWRGETQAVILWQLAKLRRHLGMEFFGYEGAPDNARWGGSYPATEVHRMRLEPAGWHVEWDADGLRISGPADDAERAIPRLPDEEVARLGDNPARIEKRFHYRYQAAEIAWRAAALLPDNHPGTLFLLHEGGRWLAHRDPKAADRFYQAIVRRCSGLPRGRELDRRRWFLPEAPASGLPELPAELRFSQPYVATAGEGDGAGA